MCISESGVLIVNSQILCDSLQQCEVLKLVIVLLDQLLVFYLYVIIC